MKLPPLQQTNPQPQEVNPTSIPQPQGQSIQPEQDPTKKANMAAGNLGFVNTLQQHLIQYKGKQNQPPQAPETPKTAPEQEQKPKVEETPKEEDKESQSIDMVTKKVDILESQMKLGFDSIMKALEKDKTDDVASNP